MSDLIKRTITGVLFVVVMLGAIITGYSFWLFLVICFFTLWEFYKMTLGTNNLTPLIYGSVLGVLVYAFVIMVLTHSFGYSHIRFARRPDTAFFVLPGMLIIVIIELFRKHNEPLKNLAIVVFGWAYIAMPFALGIVLEYENVSNKPQNFLAKHTQSVDYLPNTQIPFLVMLLILVWCNDVFAYLIGKFFGKTPLASRISPKKTVEGTLGGIIITVLATYFLRAQLPYEYSKSIVMTLLLGFIVSIMAILGDLIESKFKRQFGVKDSGNLLPGHGGLLDRFDSYIFIIPSVYLLTKIAERF